MTLVQRILSRVRSPLRSSFFAPTCLLSGICPEAPLSFTVVLYPLFTGGVRYAGQTLAARPGRISALVATVTLTSVAARAEEELLATWLPVANDRAEE